MSTFGAIALVAGREIRTRLLSKATIIATVVVVGLIVGGVQALSLLLAGRDSSATRVGVAQETASLTPVLEQTAGQAGMNLEVVAVEADAAEQQVLDGDLAAHLSGPPAGPVVTVDGIPDVQLMSAITNATQQYALTELVTSLGGDPAQAQSELAGAVPSLQVIETGTDLDPIRIVVAFVMVSLLLFALLQTTQMIAMGVVEEKVSRVVEILLATIRPGVLMAGKVLGIGVVGVVQVSLFATAGTLTALATGLLDGVQVNIAASLGWLLVWFVLGFGLYAVLVGGVAALVSRQEDIGSVTTPLFILMMAPFYLGIWLVPSNPDSLLVRVLSQIPFFAPFMMPPRQAFTEVPATDLIVAVVGALVLIPVLIWLGGRIYSRAVLTTGGRMKLREALRS
ncbi:ABC transporter permease [Pseudactinotalea sp. Z1739]|uniref:ABC transporter permease n=1 Tax=Pseudactinotalea sp. Z1739 TaxID=3413028 RepID=UPI003C7CD0BB